MKLIEIKRAKKIVFVGDIQGDKNLINNDKNQRD